MRDGVIIISYDMVTRVVFVRVFFAASGVKKADSFFSTSSYVE